MINLSGLLKGVAKVSCLALLALLVFALSACGALGGGNQPAPTAALPTAVGGGEVAALPTAPAGEEVGTGTSGGALDTPEGTWGNYLRDMIAEANESLASRISLTEHYANPDITQANLDDIAKELQLVADRTKIDLNSTETVASVKADFDVRINYANGDADTRTCKLVVEIDKKDNLWYVLNPQPLAWAAVCVR